MRRTPEATALSRVTEIRPISPVRRTWVPPHSSTDQPSAFCPCSRASPAHRYHADLVAVFLAEQRACAGFAGVVHRHEAGGDLVILQHHVVGDVLDAGELFRRDRLRMHEVEAQAIGRDQRAALGDVIAEHLPQRLVHQMRRRVMGADRGAACVIDLELQRGAELQRALLHRAEMDEEIAGLLLRIGDAEFDAARRSARRCRRPGRRTPHRTASGSKRSRRLSPALRLSVSLPSFTSAATTPSAVSVS